MVVLSWIVVLACYNPPGFAGLRRHGRRASVSPAGGLGRAWRLVTVQAILGGSGGMAGPSQNRRAHMEPPSGSLVRWTHVIYGLHGLSLLTGIIGAATVVGAFLTGWPSIVAVILNYVKRGEVRGTWLESHFRWQIRTFWYGLLWVLLCLAFVAVTLGLGLLIVWLPLGIVGLWFVYRIVRGWVALGGGRPLPM
jgi:uncharacterized membrane protein